jgi:multiple sugar transport system substrate-binding protein
MPTRRAFLRSGAAFAFAGPHRFTRRSLRDELRILQWAHPTPGYDAWLAARARAWGERHDAQVTVDHVSSSDLPGRARAELVAGRGHDLVQLLGPPTTLQADVLPLDDIVQEVSRRLGAPAPVAHGTAYNPRTRRWIAFPEHYVPLALVRRTDLVPRAPRSWADVAAVAPALRRAGHPVGIGYADELDSSAAHASLLLAHGGRIDRLGGAGTVAYLRFAARLYRRGLEREVLDWTPYSNNQLLASGGGSLIVNPRAPVGARGVAVSPVPRRAAPWVVGCTILWRFARNRELAQKWLVDQQLDYAAHERASRLVVSGWRDDGRTVAAGFPGSTNAAVQELLDAFVLTRTARHVAQGAVGAEEGARQAAAQAEPVFRKWREAGLA